MLKSIDKNNFPSTEEIFGFVEELCRTPHRKTGTPEGRMAAEYVKNKFEEFGLEDVALETSEAMCMSVDKHKLTIDGEDIECMYVNGTNRGDETGTFVYGSETGDDRFVYLGKGLEEDFKGVDVKGKIVVCDIYLNYMEIDSLTSGIPEYLICDLEGKLKNSPPVLNIYTPNNWPYNYFYAQLNGAAGFVGILQDYTDDPYWYSEDYTFYGEDMGIKYMSLPGMWISKSAGEMLKRKFKSEGELSGKMEMQSRYEYREAVNVKGIIRGVSDEIVMCHSHHDAVYAGGVQDASGVSEVLALAKYFSAPGNKKSDKTYMFATMDTHFCDYTGHDAFIEERKKQGDNVAYDFAIEHIGKDVTIENGEFVETGEGVPKIVFVSDSEEELIKDTVAALHEHGIDKTIVVPVEHVDADELDWEEYDVNTDSFPFEIAGIKILSMVSSPAYLFHPSDTPDRVMKEWLQPVGLMYAELMESV